MNKEAFTFLINTNNTNIVINRYTNTTNSRGIPIKSNVFEQIEITEPVRVFLNNSQGEKDTVNNWITYPTPVYNIAFLPESNILKDDEFAYRGRIYKVIQNPVFLISDTEVYGAYAELQDVGAEIGS
jgi:hypothetical protein